MERETAVAGRFYPSDPARLGADVARLLAGAGAAPVPQRAVGLLSPHAGYVFSGMVAGATWAAAEVPERVILLCPNHTGLGARVSLWPEGGWQTPLGTAALDGPLTAALRETGLCTADRDAHLAEHAIEVQLPFLLARRPGARIAALCLSRLSFERCQALGQALAAAARAHGAVLVASSDMSHYVPAAVARERDRLALDRLLALDPRGLHEVVERERISMCGVIPATVMLCAALELGATRARLTGYATSGDVTGDDRSVVGYAGALVS
ncbi:MAG: AmmeMemoRadiSam system protein B [Deltaproteobacteria bacterium]|nr:AmmeMemoRadiSam system protein B [Deltaproteobacteria bacterium]